MEKSSTREYSNGEVTIVWQPDLCIHSKICWRGAGSLPEVFNPLKRPWIKPEGAETEKIIEQVTKCPSGALSYYMNGKKPENISSENEIIAEAMENGPLMVYGNVTIKDKLGNETRKTKVTAFCRCGASANKPFCDGSHVKIGFQG